MERIKKNAGVSWFIPTVDRIIAGDPGTPPTPDGIAAGMAPELGRAGLIGRYNFTKRSHARADTTHWSAI